MPAPDAAVAGLIAAGQVAHWLTEVHLTDASGLRVSVDLVGEVSGDADASRVWRRELSLSVLGREGQPPLDALLGSPAGVTVAVRRGVVAPDGRPRWAPLGVCRVVEAAQKSHAVAQGPSLVIPGKARDILESGQEGPGHGILVCSQRFIP